MEVKIPYYFVPQEEHRIRQSYHENAGQALRSSIEQYDFLKLDTMCHMVELPDEVPIASNPKWADRNFGAVSTVEKSACVAFVAKVICDHFGINVSMEDLISEIENKGYRIWKLAKEPKSLCIPKAELDKIKEQFPKEHDIQKCKTLEEVYHQYGYPIGIGGSMFCIDNLIKAIKGENTETRIENIEKILSNLDAGIPVPVRVENSVYYGEKTNKKGGHYVTLYGIQQGLAFIVDSSCKESGGIRALSARQFLYAMVANREKICAWDLSSLA